MRNNQSEKSPSALQLFGAILMLPFMVIIVASLLIGYWTSGLEFNPVNALDLRLTYIFGLFFLAAGIPLFIASVILFFKIGKGTLAPWSPTKKLVVKGLYRYMRNPMITGVFFILTGEALLLRSFFILVWGGFFLLINHFYFIWKEEPGLLERFGGEYRDYKENVPRWFPRLKGWRPEGNS